MATLNEASAITLVGNGGVSLVEGNWIQLIASAVRNTEWAVIYVAPIAGHHFEAYLDIGIGGSGSEVAILNDLYMPTSSNGGDYNDVYFCLCLPLQFTLGDRISARVKDTASFGINYETSIRIFE